MRRWVVYVLGAGALASVLAGTGYSLKKGIPVDPVAVADFNNDGIEDMLIPSRRVMSGYATRLEFYDGKSVTKRGRRYLIHGLGVPTGIVFPMERQYDGTADDVNGDGNMDLVLRDSALASDPLIYKSLKEVYLGDGRGNFAFSKEHSSSR